MSKKYTYKYVKNEIEKEGYKLLSKKYINNRSPIIIQCLEGHFYKSRFYSFLRGDRCSICAGNKKLTYKYIKEQIESVKGYKLLSKSYKNSKTKIKVECSKGHVYQVKYNNFQQGQRCLKCFMLIKYSEPEKEILNIVKKFTNKLIIENDKNQIINVKTGFNLELDIWIPKLNKAIEFNGKYWHSLEKVKIRDVEKVKQCKEMGIKLLVINEQDWLDNKEKIINKIKRFIINEI